MNNKLLPESPTEADVDGPGTRTRRRMSTSGTDIVSDTPEPVVTKVKCRDVIDEALLRTGFRDMLKKAIQSRLAQAGWASAVKLKYIEYIKNNGMDDANVGHMIGDIIPKGIDIFPDELRKELEDQILDFAQDYVAVDDEAEPETPSPYDYETNGVVEQNFYGYQSQSIEPDPGIGLECRSPELQLSRSPSPEIDDFTPRPMTPQPPNSPPLHPEDEIPNDFSCRDAVGEGDEYESDDEDDDEDEEDEEEEEEENDENEELTPIVNVINHVESEEEELMDI